MVSCATNSARDSGGFTNSLSQASLKRMEYLVNDDQDEIKKD
jgi:hypothetical protein